MDTLPEESLHEQLPRPGWGFSLDILAILRDAQFMPYPGGKSGPGVYQRIITMMPPHRTYIEPFLGGGAIMRLKRPAQINIGVDLSAQAVVNFRKLLTSPDSPLRDRVSPETTIPAAHARNSDGRRYASSKTAIPPDASPKWTIRPGCGLELLESIPVETATPETLIYCDPPYLRSTRASSRALYEFEMSDVDHRRLLRWCLKARCRVMISGYWSPMYESHLPKWRCTKFQTMTRGGLAEECVWCNFPEPVALHDYTYLGEGFRERERIARKKARWTNRLARMPLLERRALLAAIASTDFFSDARSILAK